MLDLCIRHPEAATKPQVWLHLVMLALARAYLPRRAVQGCSLSGRRSPLSSSFRGPRKALRLMHAAGRAPVPAMHAGP